MYVNAYRGFKSLSLRHSSDLPSQTNHETSEKIRGKVFLDEDRNGRPDRGEKGLGGISVSDGLNVTISDESGNYILDSDYSSGIVWITLPSNHFPSASFWHNKEGRNNIDFGLISQSQSEDFIFVHISDAHVGRAEKLKQLGQTLNSLPIKIDFVVETGDLVDNNNNEPFISDAAATLSIQVNRAPDEVMVELNGELLGTIPSGTANGKTATFYIP